MANPGPASTITVNAQSLTNTQGLVLLASYKGLSVSAAGDIAMNLAGPVASFVPVTVVTSNSSGATVNVSTATVGIYTAPVQGGTAILTTAALTGQTVASFAFVRAATAVSTGVVSSGVIYANIGTAVAGGVVDLYLYGYNIS